MNRWGSAPAPGVADALPARSEVRLRMKTHPAGRGLDGAWWPRSRDPVTEFPELVLTMSSWVGPVSRVTYHAADWDGTEHAVTIDGWPVTLSGSAALEPHTVRVTGTHQRERTLLVVPPGVPGGVARALLRATAGPDVVLDAGQMLAGNGTRSGSRSRASTRNYPKG